MTHRSHRVLPETPYRTLADYQAAGGGKGLDAARRVEPSVIVDEIVASGLRGRGGAGFPTGVKWQSVMANSSTELSTDVVVNAAEGEPGTYKDRSILLDNPYAVLEGALIAAVVVGATNITIATKARFVDIIQRVRTAVAEVSAAGWTNGVVISVAGEGPPEYLYGEETALLEVLDGRPPFPRIAPPYRRGVVEVIEDDVDVDSAAESGLAGNVEMAGPDSSELAPPLLVNNVETMANIPAIVEQGAAWFRELGTPDAPGTLVCTVTGAVAHTGVGEFAMGVPLREVLQEIGGRIPADDSITVLNGVSNAVITGSQLDTALTYEAMQAIGSGLGSASFIVVDGGTDPVAVAAGVSRFLAVESCGQCTPCKQDGRQISELLHAMCRGEGTAHDLEVIRTRLDTIEDGARCSLAGQHRAVVGSILTTFPHAFAARTEPGAQPVEPMLVAEVLSLTGGVDLGAMVDPEFVRKQPDWSYGEIDSGETPVDRLTDDRAGERLADL